MEYDGASWKQITLPNNAYANDLLATKDGRIYVAGNDEAGYLDLDRNGEMKYYSLISKIKELAPGETLDFFNVVQHGDSTIFVDPFTLFILHDGKMEAMPHTTYGGVVRLGEDLFMPNEGFAFSKFTSGGKLKRIDGYDSLPPSDIVVKLLKTDDDKVIFVYSDQLYEFPYPLTTSGKEVTVRRIPHPLGEEGRQIMDAAYVGDGVIALATGGQGVVFMNRDGEVVRRITKEDGIKNDYVWRLHKDLQGSLWMALDNGIARAPVVPDFLYWDDTKGIKGYVVDITSYEGDLYAATEVGLYRLLDTGFELVKGGDLEVYVLKTIKVPGTDKEALLLGGIWGLFMLNSEGALEQIPIEPSSISAITQSRIDPSILYIGSNNLYSLKYDQGQWKVVSSIEDIASIINEIAESPDGSLWLKTPPQELVHIELSATGDLGNVNLTKYKHLTAPLSQDGINLIQHQNGEVIFGTGDGLKKFTGKNKPKEERFEPASFAGKRYENAFFSMNKVSLDDDERLWISAEGKNSRWVEMAQKRMDDQGNEEYVKDSISFVTLYNTYVECIYPDTSTVWFGGPDGIFQYRRRPIAEDAPLHSCMISKVKIAKDSILYHGRGDYIYYELPYDQNTLTFHFALPSFINEEAVQFNYRLVGYDEKWSGWGNESKKEYTNLNDQEYRFEVKARDAFGRETEVTSYTFEINPPFYLAWYAYILYTLASIGVVILAIRLNGKRLLLEKERLERIVEDRTREVVSKNEVLEKQKEEISIQAANLKKANEEATKQKIEIEKQKTELESQRDMLSDQNSEIINQRDKLGEAYNNVTVLSEIGQSITANLYVEGIIETVYESVNTLMDGTGFGIGIYNQRLNRLDFPGYIEKGEKLPFHFSSLSKNDSLDALCFNERKELFINDYHAEIGGVLEKSPKELPGDLPESIMCLPLISQDRGVGVITVQSFEKGSYSKYQMDMLRNIAIYTGIALENASVYQEISKKNRKITDSINYAQNIQRAMLPTLSEIQSGLKDSFVLFKPRDIVSGDFYWMAEQEGKIIIAAVDCTGHGVPGAFMSLVGDGFLKQIVKLKGITDPAIILTELHRMVHESLHQSDSNNRDGMDMSLCCIDYEASKMSYAGARNPLVKVDEQGRLEAIKADRHSIGGREIREGHTFTNHEWPLDGKTMYYLFSDGYQDQFGGDDNHKLCRKNFYRLLTSIYHLPPKEQNDFLEGFLQGWIKSDSQIDDILVIGFRA